MPEQDVVHTDTGAALPFFPRKHRTTEDADRAAQTLAAIAKFVEDTFVVKVDYDVIPGTSKDKTLLKPGAEKIALFFDSRPSYEIVKAQELGNGHVEYIVKCRFIEFGTNEVVAEGDGSCSTMEKKYRYRYAERKCPECSNAAIIKGKEEYGGGYICYEKKGGCKAKFKDSDPRITEQKLGTVDNPDIHDERNTVLKMAEKRACVAAGLASGCLSGYFTQDMEEHRNAEPEERPQMPQERGERREAREDGQRNERPQEGSQRAPESNPTADAIRAADPTRPKASLQKILSLAFRDDTDKIRKFIADSTHSLFGTATTLNDLAKEDARTLLEAVQKGKLKIPSTH